MSKLRITPVQVYSRCVPSYSVLFFLALGIYDVSAYTFSHAKMEIHDSCDQAEPGRCQSEDAIAGGPTCELW
jgi:hypothetical protein